jgi:hypothetical protein
VPMPEEYKLLAHLPFTDPETEAVTRSAAELGLPVSQGPEGAPEVLSDSLLIYGFVPDDVDRAAAAALFDQDTNLTLIFTDPRESDDSDVGEDVATPTPIAENMMKIAVMLAAVDGAHGVIVSDYAPDSIVLRFADGQVTLNQDWPGWQARPEALAVIPEPRTMESLQGRT